MPGIEDLLPGPASSQAEQILRLIAQYKAMDVAGDAAVNWMKSDPEMERMQREQMRLSIAGQKKSLGFPYGDEQDYENDINDEGKDRATAVMGGELARRARPRETTEALRSHVRPRIPESEGLIPHYKTATWMGPLGGDEMVSKLPKSGLQAIFKTATSIENPLTKEVGNGIGNKLLRAITRR